MSRNLSYVHKGGSPLNSHSSQELYRDNKLPSFGQRTHTVNEGGPKRKTVNFEENKYMDNRYEVPRKNSIQNEDQDNSADKSKEDITPSYKLVIDEGEKKEEKD